VDLWTCLAKQASGAHTGSIMAASSGSRRPHLASSPFKPPPDPVVEQYVLEDRVSHDAYGLGRIIRVDASGVTVDFRDRTIRISTPFRKMTKL
jgi:hypothetical protein